MAANACVQLLALLRKNFLLKLRKPISTLFEIFLPFIVMLLLVYLRSQIDTKHYNDDLAMDDTRVLDTSTNVRALAWDVARDNSTFSFVVAYVRLVRLIHQSCRDLPPTPETPLMTRIAHCVDITSSPCSLLHTSMLHL